MSRNYSELFDNHEANMLQDADNAITECKLWDWLNMYEPANGFGVDNHPNLTLINNKMKLYDSHSGSSYGWTMRHMEYIAKHGWALFEFNIREQHRKDEAKEKLNKMADSMANAGYVIAKAIMNSNGNPTPLDIAEASRDVPGFKGQADTMKKFSEGTMSYAEMRSLCG